MPRKIVFTTEKDYAADFFAGHGWQVSIYRDNEIPDESFDYLYLRDPFNDNAEKNRPELPAQIDEILSKLNYQRSIDNISSFDQLKTIEDKWAQAGKYGDFYPKSYLPSQIEFVKGQHLAKPRISQRAKDILFELDHKLDDSWIIQELLDIQEELRVYAVFGKVIPQAAIKSSKSNGSVKVIDSRILNEAEQAFCAKIAVMSELDFIGIDLAVCHNGQLKCIEVNRSPQFRRFVEYYGEDPLLPLLDL